MSTTLKCPNCNSALRLGANLAGKRVKCPRCAEVIVVPAAEEEIIEVEPEPEAITSEPGPARRRRAEEVEPEEDRPRKRRRGEEDEDDNRPRYKPCPQCGCPDAKRVKWTAWGSFYGPAMFTHVRCLECDYKYNGRSGRSNLIPAIIFVTVPLLGILGILGFIGFMIWRVVAAGQVG